MDFLKQIVRPLYYRYRQLRIDWLSFIKASSVKDAKQIPIIINNRNRLSTLKSLIEALEKRGYRNIYIIDNASTYPPLLDYYKNCFYKIFHLKENVGFLALWETGIYKDFIHNYYVYTDSDVIPIEECPSDFMEIFMNAMQKDKRLHKVGFSLKIDDLPEHYNAKKQVIELESKYQLEKVNDLFFKANVDTTFALYRPWVTGGANLYVKMYRSAYPYQVRHLPWYSDSANLTEEEAYYVKHASASSYWANKATQK